MNVLMIGRNTLNESIGGDTIQIYSTAKYLKDLNVNVDIRLSGEEIDYSKFDLMHFFNIIRPDDILSHIRKSNLPFVVSTIFVDYSEYEKKSRKGLLRIVNNFLNSDQMEYLKALARYIINGDKINSFYYLINGHKSSIKYIAARANLLLPNSHNEYMRFKEKYKITNNYMKIPNAIDTAIFNNGIAPNKLYNNHILCVGRIEGRKNQLNLIKALANTELNLTIIGKPSPNHLSYYMECKSLAEKYTNIKIIEHVNHDELAAVYKAAKVHVLPSWFETTGLSSLEAAIMDCNIVITLKGDTEEYFGYMGYYCNPDDIESIRTSVFKAYNDPVNSSLKKTILENYTWKVAAEKTLEAYELLNKN